MCLPEPFSLGRWQHVSVPAGPRQWPQWAGGSCGRVSAGAVEKLGALISIALTPVCLHLWDCGPRVAISSSYLSGAARNLLVRYKNHKPCCIDPSLFFSQVLTAWTVSSVQACVNFFRESCQLYLQTTYQLSLTWAQLPLSLVRTVAVACPKGSLLPPLLPTGCTMATLLLVRRSLFIISTAPTFLRKR